MLAPGAAWARLPDRPLAPGGRPAGRSEVADVLWGPSLRSCQGASSVETELVSSSVSGLELEHPNSPFTLQDLGL